MSSVLHVSRISEGGRIDQIRIGSSGTTYVRDHSKHTLQQLGPAHMEVPYRTQFDLDDKLYRATQLASQQQAHLEKISHLPLNQRPAHSQRKWQCGKCQV